jgi:hypothetical protein
MPRSGRAEPKGYRSIAFPLSGASSGGGKAERVQRWMAEELSRIDYEGEVRIVRYKRGVGTLGGPGTASGVRVILGRPEFAPPRPWAGGRSISTWGAPADARATGSSGGC